MNGGDRTARIHRPACPVCGATGQVLYSGLADRLFGAPGEWTMKQCPTSGCGLLWLDPAPSADDLEAAYRTYYTHRPARDVSREPLHRVYAWFKEGYFANRFGYPVSGAAAVKRAVLGPALHLLPIAADNLDMRILFLRARPGGRLLDVGCGNGSTLVTMRQMGWQGEGVDADPAAVEATRSHGIEARVGTLESQHYADDSFDAVTMSHLIEHVADPVALVRECRRILRPGGHLAIATPNAGSIGHARFRERWRGLEPPRHLVVFTAGALRRVVESAGLRVERFHTSPRLAALIHRESMAPTRNGATGGPGFADHLWMSLAYARRMLDPWSGEELALVASR